MEKQIKDTYYKAFCDLFEKNIDCEKPDNEWVIKLYAEIKEKLLKLLRPTNPLYIEINEQLDVPFFRQMLTHKVFEPIDFYKLVEYTFDVCLKLQSPARDEYTRVKKEETLQVLRNGSTFGKAVPTFIFNANECIDYIFEDIKNLQKNE